VPFVITHKVIRIPDRVAQAFLPVVKLSQTGMSVLLFRPRFIGNNSGIIFSKEK